MEISLFWFCFVLLSTNLFLDGLTNATQDNLLKSITKEPKNDTDKNKSKNHSKVSNKGDKKKINGAHLMFALNIFIIPWSLPYFSIFHKTQFNNAITLIQLNSQIGLFLLVYSPHGVIEKYGSLVLIMITVTRKTISLLMCIMMYFCV